MKLIHKFQCIKYSENQSENCIFRIHLVLTEKYFNIDRLLMETFGKIHDCCGSDISHGVFGKIVRRCIHEFSTIENYLSITLSMFITILIYLLFTRHHWKRVSTDIVEKPTRMMWRKARWPSEFIWIGLKVQYIFLFIHFSGFIVYFFAL